MNINNSSVLKDQIFLTRTLSSNQMKNCALSGFKKNLKRSQDKNKPKLKSKAVDQSNRLDDYITICNKTDSVVDTTRLVSASEKNNDSFIEVFRSYKSTEISVAKTQDNDVPNSVDTSVWSENVSDKFYDKDNKFELLSNSRLSENEHKDNEDENLFVDRVINELNSNNENTEKCVVEPNVANDEGVKIDFSIPHCPLCIKRYGSDAPSSIVTHLKVCASKHNLTTHQIFEALELQKKQALERLSLGLPTLSNKTTAKKSSIRKGGSDYSLELALALSVSLREAEELKIIKETENLLEAGLENEASEHRKQLCKPAPLFLPKSGSSKNRWNRNLPLFTRSKEEQERIITEKIAMILIDSCESNKKNGVQEYCSPICLTSPLLQKILNKGTTLWLKTQQYDIKVKDYYVKKLAEYFKPSEENVVSELYSGSTLYYNNTPNCTEAEVPDILEHSYSDKISKTVSKDTEESVNSSKHSLLEFDKTNVDFEFKDDNFSNDWRNILGKEIMNDIIVYAKDEKQIPCHKLVFAVRCSKVLEDIVIENAGNKTNEIILWLDYSYEAVLIFLEYIYTGCINSLKNLNNNSLKHLEELCSRYNFHGVVKSLQKLKNRLLQFSSAEYSCLEKSNNNTLCNSYDKKAIENLNLLQLELKTQLNEIHPDINDIISPDFTSRASPDLFQNNELQSSNESLIFSDSEQMHSPDMYSEIVGETKNSQKLHNISLNEFSKRKSSPIEESSGKKVKLLNISSNSSLQHGSGKLKIDNLCDSDIEYNDTPGIVYHSKSSLYEMENLSPTPDINMVSSKNDILKPPSSDRSSDLEYEICEPRNIEELDFISPVSSYEIGAMNTIMLSSSDSNARSDHSLKKLEPVRSLNCSANMEIQISSDDSIVKECEFKIQKNSSNSASQCSTSCDGERRMDSDNLETDLHVPFTIETTPEKEHGFPDDSPKPYISPVWDGYDDIPDINFHGMEYGEITEELYKSCYKVSDSPFLRKPSYNNRSSSMERNLFRKSCILNSSDYHSGVKKSMDDIFFNKSHNSDSPRWKRTCDRSRFLDLNCDPDFNIRTQSDKGIINVFDDNFNSSVSRKISDSICFNEKNSKFDLDKQPNNAGDIELLNDSLSFNESILNKLENGSLSNVISGNNITEFRTPSAVRSMKCKSKSDTFMTPCSRYAVSDNGVTPLADYSVMKTPDLKKELEKYGLKPGLSRIKAKLLLRYIYDELHPYVTSDDEGNAKSRINSTTLVDVNKKDRKRSNRSTIASDVENQSTYENVTNLSHENIRRTLNTVEDTKSDVINLDLEFDEPLSQLSDVSSSVDCPNEELFYENDGSDTCTQLVKTSQSDIDIGMRRLMESDSLLYHKILMYEPIWLDTLKKSLKEINVKCNLNDLMNYLDEKCITFRSRNQRGFSRNRKKKCKNIQESTDNVIKKKRTKN